MNSIPQYTLLFSPGETLSIVDLPVLPLPPSYSGSRNISSAWKTLIAAVLLENGKFLKLIPLTDSLQCCKRRLQLQRLHLRIDKVDAEARFFVHEHSIVGGKEVVDATIQSGEFMAYDYDELELFVASDSVRSTCDIPWADNELVDLSYGVASEG
ncbi:hypothetical protein LINPERPRIM_LOCUS22421 [Linum perenne]